MAPKRSKSTLTDNKENVPPGSGPASKKAKPNSERKAPMRQQTLFGGVIAGDRKKQLPRLSKAAKDLAISEDRQTALSLTTPRSSAFSDRQQTPDQQEQESTDNDNHVTPVALTISTPARQFFDQPKQRPTVPDDSYIDLTSSDNIGGQANADIDTPITPSHAAEAASPPDTSNASTTLPVDEEDDDTAALAPPDNEADEDMADADQFVRLVEEVNHNDEEFHLSQQEATDIVEEISKGSDDGINYPSWVPTNASVEHVRDQVIDSCKVAHLVRPLHDFFDKLPKFPQTRNQRPELPSTDTRVFVDAEVKKDFDHFVDLMEAACKAADFPFQPDRLVNPFNGYDDVVIAMLNYPPLGLATQSIADMSNPCIRWLSHFFDGFNDIFVLDRCPLQLARRHSAHQPWEDLPPTVLKVLEDYAWLCWSRSKARIGYLFGRANFDRYRQRHPHAVSLDLSPLPIYGTKVHCFIETTASSTATVVSRLVFVVWHPEAHLRRGSIGKYLSLNANLARCMGLCIAFARPTRPSQTCAKKGPSVRSSLLPHRPTDDGQFQAETQEMIDSDPRSLRRELIRMMLEELVTGVRVRAEDLPTAALPLPPPTDFFGSDEYPGVKAGTPYLAAMIKAAQDNTTNDLSWISPSVPDRLRNSLLLQSISWIGSDCLAAWETSIRRDPNQSTYFRWRRAHLNKVIQPLVKKLLPTGARLPDDAGIRQLNGDAQHHFKTLAILKSTTKEMYAERKDRLVGRSGYKGAKTKRHTHELDGDLWFRSEFAHKELHAFHSTLMKGQSAPSTLKDRVNLHSEDRPTSGIYRRWIDVINEFDAGTRTKRLRSQYSTSFVPVLQDYIDTFNRHNGIPPTFVHSYRACKNPQAMRRLLQKENLLPFFEKLKSHLHVAWHRQDVPAILKF